MLVPLLSFAPAQALTAPPQALGASAPASRAPAQAHAAPAQAAAATAAHRRVVLGGTVPLIPVQSKVGHLAIIRMYFTLGTQFRGRIVGKTLGHGSTALISLDDPPSRGPSYRAIAAGKRDAQIRAFLVQVERAAVRYRVPAVYIAFEHEANSPAHARLGTPAQFAAAYRHIHALAARARLNWNSGGRLHWALILEHLAYFPKSQRPRWSLHLGFASNYWPGSAVDVVAGDGYNAGDCSRSTNRHYLQRGDAMVTPGSMFNPVLAFARAHGHRPVIIAEWASIRYTSPKIRPRFIRTMQKYVLSNPSIRAAVYWDSHGGGNHGNGGPGSAACNFSVNNDPQSMAALAAMNRALRAASRA